MKLAERHNPNRWSNYELKSTMNVSVSVIPKSWWSLLKPKRSTSTLTHNKYTYLDYVFLLSSYCRILSHIYFHIPLSIYIYIYIYIYIVCVCVCVVYEYICVCNIYIYIYMGCMRERDRQTDRQKDIYIYIYIYIYIMINSTDSCKIEHLWDGPILHLGAWQMDYLCYLHGWRQITVRWALPKDVQT